MYMPVKLDLMLLEMGHSIWNVDRDVTGLRNVTKKLSHA